MTAYRSGYEVIEDVAKFVGELRTRIRELEAEVAALREELRRRRSVDAPRAKRYQQQPEAGGGTSTASTAPLGSWDNG